MTNLQIQKESTSRYHKIWSKSFLINVTACDFAEDNLGDRAIWDGLVFSSFAIIL